MDTDSISFEVKEVLIKAKKQTLLLKAIPDFREDKVFQRFIKEYDAFWKDNVDYPLAKYNEFPSFEDLSEVDDDYEFYIHCKFTWGGHFSCGDEEITSIKFRASWLNSQENESPWISSWEDELFRECKRYLRNSESLKETDLSSLFLGSINELKNIHLCLKLLNEMKIKDSYHFLMNNRINNSEGSVIDFLSKDIHLSEEEVKNTIKSSISYEEEQKQLEDDYKKFKELEKRFKNESVG